MTELQVNILEEIKNIIVEKEHEARDILIAAYFKVGQIIIENELTAQSVATYIGRSERMVQYMIAFAQQPKILDKLEKSDSWTDVIRKHLTTPKEKEEHEHTPITICSQCHARL